MVSKISEGVQVSVETFYQSEYSNPANHEFMFAYRISIENHNLFSIRLLQRKWYILDSDGQNREVEGDGVVGIQPVIESGKQFQYVSGCNLRTEMGRMHGQYKMENLHSKTLFFVNIPPFEMVVPFKMN